MVRMMTFPSRQEWLEARLLGGSDAAAAMGRCPWMSNLELWRLKTGRREPQDLSENPFVRYGTEAEAPIRELFALDYPEYAVGYEPNNLWVNDRYPHATASLDGWLQDPDGRFGVLEIKTATMQRAGQYEQWRESIPEHYYIQLLHNMAVTEAEYGVLVAQLTFRRDGDLMKITRHYTVEAADRAADIELVMASGARFWAHVTNNTEPPLRLPERRRKETK